MGLRLPLDSIPWVKESERPHLYEQDPMAERSPLPDRTSLARQQQFLADNPEFRAQQVVEQTLEPGSERVVAAEP